VVVAVGFEVRGLLLRRELRLLSANCHMIQSAPTPGEAMVERKYGLAFEIYSLHAVTFQRQGTWYIL
jgi:hypothetical protein